MLRSERQLRALADRDRLRIFEWLQRHGPTSLDRAAERLGLPADTIEAGLSRLHAAGLVEPDDEGWRAPGRGLFIQVPDDDPDTGSAARELSNVMLLAAAEQPGRWVGEVEPTLNLEWAQAAGLINAGVTLTPAELQAMHEDLERLLEPYLNRRPEDVPAAGRRVRILSFFLPDAAGGGA